MKYHVLGGLHNRGWKHQIKASAGLVCTENSGLSLWMVTLELPLLVVISVLESPRGLAACPNLFLQGHQSGCVMDTP